jgi:hypothetical protein
MALEIPYAAEYEKYSYSYERNFGVFVASKRGLVIRRTATSF